MPFTPGTRLGPYEVTAAIGSGGMGEVYRARDTRLDRTVAVKVSAAEFSERFEREARSVAALNHPNICQLYDVGPNYLVMEHVDGQPVGHVESTRRLLDLAVQMADGMAAAHAAGLVHRDLKPDNILATADGRVKILDFGLAKAFAVEQADGRTHTVPMTDPGTTLGTVAYMSPEQARGEANLGAQSDQFSLGLVLYEMATGRRAFRRESSAETMTAIIREEPEPLPVSVPAPLRWVIERLLSKEPADRYDSSRDLYRELRQIRDRLSQATAASQAGAVVVTSPPSSRRRLVRAAALVLIGVAAGAALVVMLVSRRGATGADLSRYRFTPISLETATERAPAWSPDGRSIAYLASVNGVLQVMTRATGASQAAQLTRRPQDAERPFWSPDGSTIYFSSRSDDGTRTWLWSVNATGGGPEHVIEGARSAAIHPDGRTFAFSKDGNLWLGEDARFGSAPPREFGLAPFGPPADVQGFSPDGARLAVVKDGDVWVLAFPTGEARRFPVSAIEASWMPDSRRLVLSRMVGSNMTLSILDTATGDTRLIYASGHSLMNPAVSPDGRRIAFMGGDVTWELVEVQVPTGLVRAMPSAGGVSWWPAWAPAGNHYAFVSDRAERPTVRDMSSDGSASFSRVLAEIDGVGTSISSVRWAPDGNRFSFTVVRPIGSALMLANASGSPPQPVDDRADESRLGVWSPDGEWLVYRRRVGAEEQLVKMRPGSRVEPEVLKRWPWGNPAGEARAPVDWSRDGRWILAVRGQPGFFLISPDGAVERQISRRGGSDRSALGFSHDGRSILYFERNTTGEGAPWELWSIDVATGVDRLLAHVPLSPTVGDVAGFSLHPDGTRFLTSIANWPFDLWMLEGFDQ